MYSPKDIAELRKRLGLSVAEFAKKLNVHRTTVYHWESGHSHPVYTQLVRINKLASRATETADSA